MPVRVTCAKCAKVMNLKDEFAGKKIRCPGCKEVIQVPALSKPAPVSTRSTAKRPARVAPAKKPQTATEPTVTMSKDGTICPSCGTPIPKGGQSCPKCKYHLKLKRKLGISNAIHKANMHSQGMNTDGSKKMTRSAEAEVRAEQGRKIGTGIKIAIFSLIGIFIISFIVFIATRLDDYTVDQLRRMSKPEAVEAQNPETYNPLMISLGDEKITVKIPASSIEAESPKFPEKWPVGESKAWADFVQALMPPIALTPARFSADSAVPVINRANELGGAYSPAKLMQGAPKTPIYVWRLSRGEAGRELGAKGSLRGAILDFGGEEYKEKILLSASESMKEKIKNRNIKVRRAIAREKAFGGTVDEKKINDKYPMPKPETIEITARLSFIPFFDWDMDGTIGSYRFSAENGSPNVRNPASTRKRDKKDLPRFNNGYFAPVLLVEQIRVLQAADK